TYNVISDVTRKFTLLISTSTGCGPRRTDGAGAGAGWVSGGEAVRAAFLSDEQETAAKAANVRRARILR
ncbi:MAG: hypothetical protein ABIS29_00020, partial [Vicinamibacterales bacterium]